MDYVFAMWKNKKFLWNIYWQIPVGVSNLQIIFSHLHKHVCWIVQWTIKCNKILAIFRLHCSPIDVNIKWCTAMPFRVLFTPLYFKTHRHKIRKHSNVNGSSDLKDRGWKLPFSDSNTLCCCENGLFKIGGKLGVSCNKLVGWKYLYKISSG